MKILLTLVAACGLVVLLLGALQPSNPEKNRARDVISLCWDDQKRKSNSPGRSRAVAAACEQMEAEFRAKYNGATP